MSRAHRPRGWHFDAASGVKVFRHARQEIDVTAQIGYLYCKEVKEIYYDDKSAIV